MIKQLKEKNITLQKDNHNLVSECNKLKQIIQQQNLKIQNLEKLNLQTNISSNRDTPSIDQVGQLTQYQASQLNQLEKEVKRIQNVIEERNQEIAKLRAILLIYQSNPHHAEQQKLQNDIDLLKDREYQLKKENDQLMLNSKMDAAFRIEMNQLRAENQFLNASLGRRSQSTTQGLEQLKENKVELKLLKKQFSSTPTNKNVDQCLTCQREIHYYRPCCNLLSQIDPNLFEVPAECYSFAQAFKLKYINDKNDLLVDEIFEVLLFELNKIWFNKQQELKQRNQRQIKELSNKVKRSRDILNVNEKDTLMTIRRLKNEKY
ncbi:hypothetical protein pb186bvf_002175 [Paramecium bursaria]